MRSSSESELVGVGSRREEGGLADEGAEEREPRCLLDCALFGVQNKLDQFLERKLTKRV